MKRRIRVISLFVGIMLLVSFGYSTTGVAGVNINIGLIAPLPTVVIPSPPHGPVMARTQTYYVPDVNVDVFFYHDYWYRPYEGCWYRSGDYNGPWVYIVPERVPAVLLHPATNIYHVPYGYLKKNWKRWNKEKYWHKHRYEHEDD